MEESYNLLIEFLSDREDVSVVEETVTQAAKCSAERFLDKTTICIDEKRKGVSRHKVLMNSVGVQKLRCELILFLPLLYPGEADFDQHAFCDSACRKLRRRTKNSWKDFDQFK